jgi:hypothetical protein
MAAEKPHQDAFLAAIEAKIAAWKAVADSYRAAAALDGPLGEPSPIRGALSVTLDPARTGAGLPVGVFRDKSLKEAIPIYLAAGHRKQANKEIAIGLQAGGFPTTATNFEATVATALYRLKSDGVLLRFSDGWDLASSYPDSLRSRLEKDAPARSTSKRRKKLRAKVRRSAPTEAAKGELKKPASTVVKIVRPKADETRRQDAELAG